MKLTIGFELFWMLLNCPQILKANSLQPIHTLLETHDTFLGFCSFTSSSDANGPKVEVYNCDALTTISSPTLLMASTYLLHLIAS